MPKILWMSPFSIHDLSSGAAIRCNTTLHALKNEGWDVWTLSSFIFDDPAGAKEVFGDLNKMLLDDPSKVFVFEDEGIRHVYTRTSQTEEFHSYLDETDLFYKTFCDILNEFEPDIVVGYGLSPAPYMCFAEAHRRGISTVYMLANGSHKGCYFTGIDLIATTSKAMHEMYSLSTEINAVALGQMFNLETIIAKSYNRQFVTLINASPAKGAAIFAKIAEVCRTEIPDLQFLVINTRQRFENVLGELHTKGNPDEHPYKVEDFTNVNVLDAQKNVRTVYGVTKVLLAPSLWYEAWGRVASEATLNGIPVISTNSGGLVEATAGAGIVIEAPMHCIEDNLSIPTDEEIRPWIDALKKALRGDCDKDIERAKKELNNETSLARIIEAFNPLVEKTQLLRPLYKLCAPGEGVQSVISRLALSGLKGETNSSFDLKDINLAAAFALTSQQSANNNNPLIQLALSKVPDLNNMEDSEIRDLYF